MQDFTTGKQPCANFKAYDEGLGGNLHECWAPFHMTHPKCVESHGGMVSFCAICQRDHHSGGYETCAAQYPQRVPEPDPPARPVMEPSSV